LTGFTELTGLAGLGQEETQSSGFESGFFRAVVAWINAGVVESETRGR